VHGKGGELQPVRGELRTGTCARPRLGLFEARRLLIPRRTWTLQGQVGIGPPERQRRFVQAADGTLREALWWGVSACAA